MKKPKNERDDRDFPEFSEIVRGQTLSNLEAAEMETLLLKEPDNLAFRLTLIGFYLRRKRDAIEERFRHLFWLIDNAPDHVGWREIARMSIRTVYPNEILEGVKASWTVQVTLFPSDGSVLGNAGLFLIEHDFRLGDQMLEKAMNLQPNEEFWPNELSLWRYIQARDTKSGNRAELARMALVAGQRFLKMYGSEGGRRSSPVRASSLELCARAAFWLEDFSLAEEYAEQHKLLISNWKTVFPKSSRSLIGLISLKKGELNEAKRQLLWLDKFSLLDRWDLELADELIKLGEFGTVISYLEKCRSLGFWPHLSYAECIGLLQKKTIISLLRDKAP